LDGEGVNYERALRRLLVLNNYGYSIENTDLDTDASKYEFLSDEWLSEWYGSDWCEGFVQDELDAVDLLASARTLSELDRLREFRNQLDTAHKEHLRTGDYAPLGMAAQDALRALEKS
jgi:hypothetical protein